MREDYAGEPEIRFGNVWLTHKNTKGKVYKIVIRYNNSITSLVRFALKIRHTGLEINLFQAEKEKNDNQITNFKLSKKERKEVKKMSERVGENMIQLKGGAI